jgi:hypothetical protein
MSDAPEYLILGLATLGGINLAVCFGAITYCLFVSFNRD